MLGIGLVILLAVSLLGGYLYLEHRKEVQLYQRGFRLLEEQLGVYIKEHYSGVSKVEFTDISGYRYYAMSVHPIITDEFGNRTYLDEGINGAYEIGYLGEDGFGEPLITLMDYDKSREIDVSKDKTLPAKAKLETYESMDKKIQILIEEGKVKGIQKSDQGSPKMKIVYNLKVTIKD